MSLAEKIYNHSPIFIQNLLITAYGYRLKKARYTQRFHHYCSSLIESQHYSSDKLRELQEKRFQKVLSESLPHVPFYQSILKEKALSPSEINLNNYTSVFPVLTKEILRNNQHAFVNSQKQPHKTETINTSGTSGTPLSITTTTDTLQQNYAFFNRCLSWAGVKHGDRCATFAGRVFISPTQNKAPYWRYNHASNAMLCSSYHISSQTIPSYIRALEKFDPVYIDSYPSALYEIAKYINQTGLNHTSSETLFDYQRAALEQAFHCKVYDHLGSAEMVTLISQCEHGQYHFNPEFGLFEILDEDDAPVATGTPGRLICTSLINPAMPLIRYELGDSVTLSPDSCECGRHFPVVASLVGRTDDMIIGCDGRRIGRLDPIFKKMSSEIKETQIIQNDLTNITLKIVADDNYDKKLTNNIIDELKIRIGDCIQYHVEYVDTIPKTRSGKFRAVVSLIDTAQ